MARNTIRSVVLAGAVLLAGATSVEGQRPARRAAPATPPQQAASEVTLVYERETFSYAGSQRRDPFLPLTNENQMGPRFETLSLRGIIFSTGRGRSVALLGDSDGRVYRARVGDVVGNATVVEIGPLRVVLAVENFGSIRQEMLELQRNQGANR